MISIRKKFTLDSPPTDLEAFAMFNIHVGDAMSHITGEDVNIPDDLWYERSKLRRGEMVTNELVKTTPDDVQPTAHEKRLANLKQLYAVLIPLERSPFPEPPETEYDI